MVFSTLDALHQPERDLGVSPPMASVISVQESRYMFIV